MCGRHEEHNIRGPEVLTRGGLGAAGFPLVVVLVPVATIMLSLVGSLVLRSAVFQVATLIAAIAVTAYLTTRRRRR